MAETIYQGYVINRIPFQIFDEIVTFLISAGQKIPCMSRGSRRLISKNARNLFIGSYVELQIFQSTREDKLSKLKKVVAIKAADWNYENNEAFNLLNECIVLINVQNQNIFSFYKESLQMILDQTYNDKIMVLIIMRKFFALSGGHLEVNKCIKCGNNKLKTISFKEHGMLCNLCFNSKRDKYYELPISKAIHYLFNDQYSQLTQYFHEIDFLIKILKIYIEDMLGIKIKTLIKY